jgi:hypothetical protein
MKKMKSKFTLSSLVFSAILLTSCGDNNYEQGQKEFDEKNYESAISFLKNVPTDDENYKSAQSKIYEIETIQTELAIEEMKRDSIAKIEKAKVDLENLRSQVKSEIESIKTFNGNQYRSDITSIEMEIVIFGAWAEVINEAEKNKDKEINKDGKILKTKVIALQKSEFSKLRKSYGDFIKKELWANNIEASTKGPGSSTLEFIGATFANNKNKEDTQKTLRDILTQLRFKRVNYKWYKYDDEYTYYSMDTPTDGELVTY